MEIYMITSDEALKLTKEILEDVSSKITDTEPESLCFIVSLLQTKLVMLTMDNYDAQRTLELLDKIHGVSDELYHFAKARINLTKEEKIMFDAGF